MIAAACALLMWRIVVTIDPLQTRRGGTSRLDGRGHAGVGARPGTRARCRLARALLGERSRHEPDATDLRGSSRRRLGGAGAGRGSRPESIQAQGGGRGRGSFSGGAQGRRPRRARHQRPHRALGVQSVTHRRADQDPSLRPDEGQRARRDPQRPCVRHSGDGYFPSKKSSCAWMSSGRSHRSSTLPSRRRRMCTSSIAIDAPSGRLAVSWRTTAAWSSSA